MNASTATAWRPTDEFVADDVQGDAPAEPVAISNLREVVAHAAHVPGLLRPTIHNRVDDATLAWLLANRQAVNGAPTPLMLFDSQGVALASFEVVMAGVIVSVIVHADRVPADVATWRPAPYPDEAQP